MTQGPALTSNAFLQALSPGLRQRVLEKCRLVDLPLTTVLFGESETPRHVHFLESGVASLTIPFLEGEASEVGLVGNESFPEKLFLLGPQTVACKCFMQLAGSGYRLPFRDCQAIFAESAEFREIVLKHTQYEWLVLMQLTGCNRFHEAEQRLARWLLMVADRVGEELDLTQEFLAAMLGLRRSTVTVVASALQARGMIRYSRGHIELLNRAALEETACECYFAVRKVYSKIKAPKLIQEHNAR